MKKKHWYVRLHLAILLLGVSMLFTACHTQDEDKGINPKNQAKYITDSDKLSMIHSMKDLAEGKLYELNYTVDYKLKDLVESQIVDMKQLTDFIASKLYDISPTNASLSYGAGCSAFGATINDGTTDKVMGRNFDYAHKDEQGNQVDIAAVIVHTAPLEGFKSVSVIDSYWGGLKKGFYTDGETDLSMMMAFPYLLMDGMNEKGFAIGVLHLDGKPTKQENNKPKISTTVAMRYLLDHATDVNNAIEMLNNFDMYSITGEEGGNYHFFIADSTGNFATIEYVCPKKDDGNYDYDAYPSKFVVLKDKPYWYVTNFYIAPDMDGSKDGKLKSSHGMDRYEDLQNVLIKKDFNISKKDAMNLLKKVSQYYDPAEPTSHTQWSSLYNLSEKKLDVSVVMDYSNTYSFKIE